MSTFAAGTDSEALWKSLDALTDLIYKELDGHPVPVTREMLLAYYEDLR